jgi:hypothetical protein
MYVILLLFYKCFLVKGVEPHGKKKQREQPHEENRRKKNLRERFIKKQKTTEPCTYFSSRERTGNKDVEKNNYDVLI